MIDRYTWDEADLKVKALTYLSLGTEATRIFHQRNPHTMIDRFSTNELVYELGLTFTRPRNLIFDRFQLITVQQKPNENLETFFSRLRELGSKAALGNVEEDLLKDFFIAKMNITAIQMKLLSEVRTAAQVLNFALSRERGQENQKKFSVHQPQLGIARSTVSETTTHAPHRDPNNKKSIKQTKQTNHAGDVEEASQQGI